MAMYKPGMSLPATTTTTTTTPKPREAGEGSEGSFALHFSRPMGCTYFGFGLRHMIIDPKNQVT
jgi:hypothetical protein